MSVRFCTKCTRMLDEKTRFYGSNNLEKYPDGKLNICKECLTMHVDNWDPETYKWILEEIDIPYVKRVWVRILNQVGTDPKKLNGTSVLGRYISQMKLKQFKGCRWADTERLAQEEEDQKTTAMKAQGLTDEEIQEQLQVDITPPKPKNIPVPGESKPSEDITDSRFAFVAEYEKEDADLDEKLSEEDKQALKLKWGREYRLYEQIRMEKLYNDMMKSYDIQSASHKDTLILICKTSLKANQLIDSGDVEGAQKMLRMYDALMKSGKFTAAQNKEEQGEYVDSIGALVTICEEKGFIPQYYTSEPKDQVDKTLLDLQHYTHTLVMEEMNLGEMIESSMKEIAKDRAREAIANTDTDEEENPNGVDVGELFDYNESPIEDEEFQKFFDMQQMLEDSDNEEMRR